VLLEVSCESDFVARNEGFVQFTKDVAMQIAATSPLYLKREDVPVEVLENEKSKEDFYKNHCLLEQPFVKDGSKTVAEVVAQAGKQAGGNAKVKRFVRFAVG